MPLCGPVARGGVCTEEREHSGLRKKWSMTFKRVGLLLCIGLAFGVRISTAPALAEATVAPPVDPEPPEMPRELFPTPPDESESDEAEEEAGAPIPGRYIVVLKDSVDRPGEVAAKQTEQRDGKLGFVDLGPANRVAVIDGVTHAVLKYLLVGQRVWHGAFTPDEKYLLVANGVSNDVSVIDVAAQKVIKSIQVGELPWGVAFGPN